MYIDITGFFQYLHLFIFLISFRRVFERLLFNANAAIFQLYHGKNRLIFEEMMMRSALY